MKAEEAHLELLLGRPVRAANGRTIGHLEEVQAEKQGTGWVVTEYHVGVAAPLERLAANLRGLFRGGRLQRGYAVRWDQLDVSDPHALRLTCSVDDLRPLEPPR